MSSSKRNTNRNISSEKPHPKWQYKFIPLLKEFFPKTTFYIATHSPVIISTTDEGEAYELIRDGANVTAKKLGNPKEWYLADVVLILLYILISWWDLISIVIGLPFILITLVLGPFMIVVFVLATVVLGLYFVEGVLGYDIEGHSSLLETSFQAFVALGAWVIAFLVLRWHFSQDEGEDWVIEKVNDLSFNLRQQLQERVGDIIQKDGKEEYQILLKKSSLSGEIIYEKKQSFSQTEKRTAGPHMRPGTLFALLHPPCGPL